MPGFHIENFGCRAARADGEAIGNRLLAGGLVESSSHAADLVVINTCSVTAEADREARASIRRVHRRNPAAKIVVTGCYAQRAPEELAAIAGVSAVVGNSHKALAPGIALNLLQSPAQSLPAASPLVNIAPAQSASTRAQGFLHLRGLPAAQAASAPPQMVWADDRFAHSFLEDAQLAPGEQTRPNLKIQEGCGNRCTFCVIPFTRGPSRSLSRAAIFAQVESFIAAGGKELVLSGINLGRWGADFPGAERDSLASLVRDLLLRTSLPRLRLSSIEPMDWNDDLIALMRDFGGSRLARHAHLPLQSGSDAVLRRMHRRYRPWHYAEKVAALLRAAGPDLTLGADVMVGFPGETDAGFDETVTFLRSLPFGYLHLFPFSPRPGTPGWSLHSESPVPPVVMGERVAVLRELAAEISRAHRLRFVGHNLEAITLNTPAALAADGRTSALTENFLPVEIEGCLPANELINLRVENLNAASTLLASASLHTV